MRALIVLLMLGEFVLAAGALPAQTVSPVSPAQQTAPERPGALQWVTVAELAERLAKAKLDRDGKAAREIEHLQLAQRLSSQRLAALDAELAGKKSKAALLAVADVSVFLDPPADEIVQKPAPDLDEQRRMMLLVVDYLRQTIPKLPDFYAKRTTTSFQENGKAKDKKGVHTADVLHPAGEFKATVYYRLGREVVHAEGAQEHGLVTRGTFGPILGTVVVDAARSTTTRWSRWENGANGPMAVFSFQTPQKQSHYDVTGSGELGGVAATAYHGEIGIDPGSGTILRLVLEADPDLGSSMERADIMVEYGPVAIGGKTYTCPVRSVSYSVGAVFAGISADFATIPAKWTLQAARLNDVVFSDYHVFRSEIRIVP
jgi:hypothetical protein